MPPLPLRSYRMFERAYAWAFPMFGEKHQIRRFYRLFQHAYTGNNLRAAVNAFCYKCADFIPKEVKECTEQACPLWMYRPGKARKGA